MRRCKDCKWCFLFGLTEYCGNFTLWNAPKQIEPRDIKNCPRYKRIWWKFWRPK